MNNIYEKQGNADFDRAVKLILKIQGKGFSIPPSPAGEEFRQAWMDAVNRVLSGQQSPAAALRAAQREAQRAIARARR